jgi:hypothetical protein
MTRAAEHFDIIFIEEPEHIEGGRAGVSTSVVSPGITRIVPRQPRDWSDSRAREHFAGVVDEALAGKTGRLVAWYYTPMLLEASEHIGADVVVYDNMDELSAFAGAPPAMVATERRMFEAADIVFCGGRSLFDAKRGRHGNIHCFPSSIEARHFGAARTPSLPEPADQAAIPEPRIGFFGVIDERMDLALLEGLAAARPDVQFVMIGPTAKIDPASLPRADNIHWLGMKGYGDLPRYLAGWQAGIMPFAINDATRYISPTKTPEFLAAGLPVVSTPIRDVVSTYGAAGLVEIAETADAFASGLDHVLSRPRQPWLAEVDACLALQSWDTTWSEMLSIIADELADAPAAGPTVAEREAADV